MSRPDVAETIWEILMRPHHRRRWEAWSRPGAVRRRPSPDEREGAQSSIAWVVDDHRYQGVREEWDVPDSAPSSRSAVHRLFRIGARPLGRPAADGPIEGLTRSKVLIDIVRAFELDDAEVNEVRAAFSASSFAGSSHLGRSLHAWEFARTDDDLRSVVELSRRVIGGRAGFKSPDSGPPTAADIAPLRSRVGTRSDAVELCIRQDLDTSETVVGYILAYPLDLVATSQVIAGEVSGADEIGDQHVATSLVSEASFYIGMVLGSDLPARASVMERCIERVVRWSAAHPDGYVFARRSTGDGQRWLEHYSFVPISDRNGIWVRDSSAPPARRPKSRHVASDSCPGHRR